MPFLTKPVIKNVHMNDRCFVYSDGNYDYAIVNGSSLTKYFGNKPGDYESYPIHIFSDPITFLTYKENYWIIKLLKIDSSNSTPLYKMKKELSSRFPDINIDDFLGFEI